MKFKKERISKEGYVWAGKRAYKFSSSPLLILSMSIFDIASAALSVSW